MYSYIHRLHRRRSLCLSSVGHGLFGRLQPPEEKKVVSCCRCAVRTSGFISLDNYMLVCPELVFLGQAGGVSCTTIRRYFASGTMTNSCFLVRNRNSFKSSYSDQARRQRFEPTVWDDFGDAGYEIIIPHCQVPRLDRPMHSPKSTLCVKIPRIRLLRRFVPRPPRWKRNRPLMDSLTRRRPWN